MFVSLPKLVGGGHCYVRINRSQVQPHWHIHGLAVIAIVSPRFQFDRQFAKCHNRRADAYVHIHTQPTYHNTHGTELQIKQCVCTLFMVECGLALAEFHRMLMTFGLIENYLWTVCFAACWGAYSVSQSTIYTHSNSRRLPSHRGHMQHIRACTRSYTPVPQRAFSDSERIGMGHSTFGITVATPHHNSNVNQWRNIVHSLCALPSHFRLYDSNSIHTYIFHK